MSEYESYRAAVNAYNEPYNTGVREARNREAATATETDSQARRSVVEEKGQKFIVEDRPEGRFLLGKEGEPLGIGIRVGDTPTDEPPGGGETPGGKGEISRPERRPVQIFGPHGGEFGKGFDETINSVLAGFTEGGAAAIANTGAALGFWTEDDARAFNEALRQEHEPIVSQDTGDVLTREIAGVATQYGAPIGVGYTVARAAGAGPLVASLISEPLAGALAIDPDEGTLANLIPEDSPAFRGLRELLATDPEDPEWVNRARQAGDALMAIGGGEVAIRGLITGVKQATRLARTALAKTAGTAAAAGGATLLATDAEAGMAEQVVGRTVRAEQEKRVQNAVDSEPVDRRKTLRRWTETTDISREDLNALGVSGKFAPQKKVTGTELIGAMEPPEEFRVAGLGSRLLKGAQRALQKAPREPLLSPEDLEAIVRGLDAPGAASGAERGEILGQFDFKQLQDAEDIDAMWQAIAKRFAEQDTAARRGVLSLEDQDWLAERVGMSPERLVNRRTGEAYNAEELRAAKAMVVGATRKLRMLLERAKAADTTENLVELRRHAAITGAMLLQFKGARAEAGRALGAMRGTAKTPVALERENSEFLDLLGGHQSNTEFVRMLDSLIAESDEATAARFLMDSRRATTVDMLFEAWINSLLGNPATHLVNSSVNMAILPMLNGERWLAATYGTAERALHKLTFGKIGQPGGITYREAAATTVAQMASIREAFRTFGTALRTGRPADRFAKLDFYSRPAISSGNINQLPLVKAMSEEFLAENGVAARAVDLIADYYYRLPSRFLVAEDEFFKTMAYRGEVAAQATRTVFEEGLRGEAAAKRYAEIIADPEFMAPQVHIDAVDFSRYATLQTPPGAAAKGLSAFRQELEFAGVPLGRVVAPFFNVLNNIMKFTGERMPVVSLGSKRIRQELIGADPAKRQTILAQWSMGAGALGVAAAMTSGGLVTGRMTDNPEMRSLLAQEGMQEYSIFIPWTVIDPKGRLKKFHKGRDGFVSFKRTAPIGSFLAIAADTVTALAYEDDPNEREALVTAAIAAIVPYMLDQHFAAGISDMFEAINPTHAYGDARIDAFGRFLSDLAATSPGMIGGPLAPGTPLSGNIRRQFDPFRRSTRPDPHQRPEFRMWERTVNRIFDRTVGLSKRLPAWYNMFGEPQRFEGGLGPDMISPFYTRAFKLDTERMRKAGLPERMWKNKDWVGMRIGQDLTREQFGKFIEQAGIVGEMIRLGWPGSMPVRRIDGIELDEFQYARFIRLQGNELKYRVILPGETVGSKRNQKEALEALVRSDGYADLPDDPEVPGETKLKAIRKVIAQYREAARQTMLDPKNGDHDLIERVAARRARAIQNLPAETRDRMGGGGIELPR